MSTEEVRRAGILERVRQGDLKQMEAATLLGISYRQTKRLMKRYRGQGPKGWRTATLGVDRDTQKGTLLAS